MSVQIDNMFSHYLVLISGVKHEVQCCQCKVEEIYGFLWQCSVCEEVNLCSDCYHTDAHDINHQFDRFDSGDTEEG